MSDIPLLIWGIKASLLEYVEKLDDGLIETLNGATRIGDEFSFTYDEQVSSCDSSLGHGVQQFRGSVILSGHWGAMRVEIHDPRLTISDGAGELSSRTNSVLSAERFETFAHLELTSPAPHLRANTQLAAAGRMMLGQQYSIGQELCPLRVVTT